MRVNPTIYSKLHTVNFNAGSLAYAGTGTIVIPITDISTSAGLTAENFNVQYSIQNTKPLASSISSVEISGTDLVINLEASEYDGTWDAFYDEVSVHIFVSVMI